MRIEKKEEKIWNNSKIKIKNKKKKSQVEVGRHGLGAILLTFSSMNRLHQVFFPFHTTFPCGF